MGDGEAKAGAFHPIGERRVPLLEGLAEPRQGFGRDAGTIVLDIDVHRIPDAARADIDAAMFGRELHRILQQRREHPLECGAVAEELSLGGDLAGDGDRFFPRRGLDVCMAAAMSASIPTSAFSSFTRPASRRDMSEHVGDDASNC